MKSKQGYKKRNINFVNTLKTECSLCGRKNCKLIFHHPNPDNKTRSVSSLMRNSLKRLKEEIDKCIVVCRKCHRKLHNEDIIKGIIKVKGYYKVRSYG